jgi:hypothetical protein
MKTLLKLFIVLLFVTSCGTKDNINKPKVCEENISKTEKWILIQDTTLSRAGFGYKSGYVNEKGDTMIPLDRYLCYSDTFEYYAIVWDIEKSRLIGINKNEKKLFNALFTAEMEAKQESDGRLMVVSDNKYGFVNHKGEIVIEPKYSCAESFIKGVAKVSNNCRKSKDEHFFWESDHWIYIDKCGNEVSKNNK